MKANLVFFSAGLLFLNTALSDEVGKHVEHIFDNKGDSAQYIIEHRRR